MRNAAVIALWLTALPIVAEARDPGYLSDVPKLYPKAFALWQQSLPRSLPQTKWIARFEGVVSPIRAVTIDGRTWQFGTVCVPHDCGANIMGVLFSQQQDSIFAVARLTGGNEAPTTMMVGAMQPRIATCIGYFIDANDASVCKP